MKILGVSAHYHDAAAALVIDGVPVAAVQEERLSRRKNDAAFPMAAIEWCLEQAGLEPDDLDAVVFYERPMLKFDRILTCALRAFPHSWRSFPHAMKNSLSEKLWVRASSRPIWACRPAQNPVYRTSPLTCRRGFSDRAGAGSGHSDRGRCGRMGDADSGAGQARAGRHRDHPAAGNPLSPFAGHALLDLHRLSRLCRQRRRIQGDGAG